eukprot:CAMPEP_0185255674 /NCGR_PEP_ID=MMETSP1359-20130426/4750_1 /TAXON_ID=552665 /ORGANISM="Bigelowiella longifila, Strain CCMP242" /LENGTH=208 /DNA_ID=CAMNT_0027839783 /DNA_START=275 /DNA_END=901 /DNA_ORIENTATION=-
MEEERSKSAKEEEISIFEEMQRKIKQAYEKVEDEAHQARSRQKESQDWFSKPDLRSQKRLMALAVKSKGLEGERDKYTTAQLEDYERIISTPSNPNPLVELPRPRKRNKKIETSSSQDSEEKEEYEYMKLIDSAQGGVGLKGKLHLPGLASKSADNNFQDINDIEEDADESADDGEENERETTDSASEGDESPPPAPPAAGFTPSKLE